MNDNGETPLGKGSKVSRGVGPRRRLSIVDVVVVILFTGVCPSGACIRVESHDTVGHQPTCTSPSMDSGSGTDGQGVLDGDSTVDGQPGPGSTLSPAFRSLLNQGRSNGRMGSLTVEQPGTVLNTRFFSLAGKATKGEKKLTLQGSANPIALRGRQGWPLPT